MTNVFYFQPDPDDLNSQAIGFSLIPPDLSGFKNYIIPESLTGAIDISKVDFNAYKISDALKMPSAFNYHVEESAISKVLAECWKQPVMSDALTGPLQYWKTFKSPLQDYIEAEDRLGKQIKAMSESLYKPSDSLIGMFKQQKQLIDAVEKTNNQWQDLNKPIVMDGMFTLPNYVVQSKSYEIGTWSDKYNQMYLRIAEELRRQRIELSSMFEILKRSPAVEEFNRLMQEHALVCQLADSVHRRLCEVEKFTSTRCKPTVGFTDEFLAELRLDHGIMDDSLARIGEIPASELLGQNQIVTKTWYRLRLFASELKRIDNDLSWLFLQILD